MKKYFVKAFFENWNEVSQQQCEEFKRTILDGALNVNKSNPEEVETFLSHHVKEVEE